MNSMVAFFTSGRLIGSSCIFVDGLYRKSSGTEIKKYHFTSLLEECSCSHNSKMDLVRKCELEKISSIHCCEKRIEGK